jgi:hypothetical protein
MTNFYNPTPQQGTPSLGPYTEQQAPFLECSNCGTPITVGQRYTMVCEYLLGVDLATGQLVPVACVDFEESVAVHSACSAEYAHDQITKEPCGKDEEDAQSDCPFCGAEGCTHCRERLREVDASLLKEPVTRSDILDQEDMIENAVGVQKFLFDRVRNGQPDTAVTNELWYIHELLNQAAERLSNLRAAGVFPDT